MNRRQWIRRILAAPLAVAPAAAHPWLTQSSQSTKKRIAITMDDPRHNEEPLMSARERDDSILEALERANVKAGLFVCGKRVDDDAGKKLLSSWNDRGHFLANHSYSHHYYHEDSLTSADFIADIARGERIIEGYSQFRRWFRFPMLKGGDTEEKRDRARSFLTERRYTAGQVTIDTSDWYIDQRLRDQLERAPSAELDPYREFYLRHMTERADFYRTLASECLGRDIPHTLLMHHNLLNALFLGDLIAHLRAGGWTILGADEVYADEVFRRRPNTMPAGESLVWALAKESGRFEDRLRYPGEDGEYEKPAMDALRL